MSTPETDQRALENSTLIVATFTSFLGPFMISAVNVGLPAIQAEFQISAVLLSWIGTAYLLATAVFLVPIGKLADIYGRKKVFTLGLVTFTISAFFSAIVGSIEIFLFLRVLQGFGAAMVVTTGMAIVTSVFPPQRRGRAIGLYVAAVYIGLSVGPTVGGALTHHMGWRSIFWTVVPLSFVSIYITVKYLKGEWKGAPDERFDWVGSVLYGTSLVALIYGATLLPHPRAVILAGAGFLGLIGFWIHQMSIPNPVFEVRLFRTHRVFTFSSIAALINYSATFALTFLMSLYLQYVKGLNPQTAGLILVAQPVMMALFSPVAGRLSDRFEPRILSSAGMSLTALGLLQLVFLNEETSIPYIVGILIMLGLGFAMFSSPNMNAIMSSVEKRYYGIASGAVATMRLLGQMLSMAIATVTFAVLLGNAQIGAENLPLFLKSVKIVFLILTVLCTVGIFFSISRGELRQGDEAAS
jgi:EmrB/QacA subfamily drug resistance transporter